MHGVNWYKTMHWTTCTKPTTPTSFSIATSFSNCLGYLPKSSPSANWVGLTNMEAMTTSFCDRAARARDICPGIEKRTKYTCHEFWTSSEKQYLWCYMIDKSLPSWRAPIVGTKPTDTDGSSNFRTERMDSMVGWIIGCVEDDFSPFEFTIVDMFQCLVVWLILLSSVRYLSK